MNRKRLTQRLTDFEYFIAFVSILLYTAVIFTLAGCSEDSDDPEPAAVTGKVLPIGSGAIVNLVRNDIVVDSADVDPEGNYAFSDLLEGQYDLVIMSAGYITRSHTFQVVEGQITEIGAITLEKVPPSAVIVTGKVVDSQTGEPIADALVLVEYEESGTTTFSYTRKDGRFTISIQTDLSPAITISKAGYEPSEINAGDVDNVEVDLKRTSGYVPPSSAIARITSSTLVETTLRCSGSPTANRLTVIWSSPRLVTITLLPASRANGRRNR